MKDLATQPKETEPRLYKKEKLFAHKREQKKRILSTVDPKQLEAIRAGNYQQ